MNPERNKIWFPVGRLSIVFVAVVVAINLLLHSLVTPAETQAGSRTDHGFLARKSRQIQRNWQAIQRFLYVNRDSPPPSRASTSDTLQTVTPEGSVSAQPAVPSN